VIYPLASSLKYSQRAACERSLAFFHIGLKKRRRWLMKLAEPQRRQA
jgi:hypothetical protein